MKIKHHVRALGLAALVLASGSGVAGEPGVASGVAGGINAFGLELLRRPEVSGNALVSPYSIQTALAMTYAGAAGATRDEMGKVLHFPANEDELHQAMVDLRKALEEIEATTAAAVKRRTEAGEKQDPVVLSVANRLFGQKGFEFKEPFLKLVGDRYVAPLQEADFAVRPNDERLAINHWVEEKTHSRIRDLIPEPAIDKNTILVLVNAIYLKAPWREPFPAAATAPLPFQVAKEKTLTVPTMHRTGNMGYADQKDFQVVAIPYFGNDLQLLVLVPKAVDGLAAVEKQLTPGMLAGFAKLGDERVSLYLPKFKMEPPSMMLTETLKAMGMKEAFDSKLANFERMYDRTKARDNLHVTDVVHKAFIELDEQGTEAAAATAVIMGTRSMAMEHVREPVEVRVDRPFLFAIQHRSSGACLFLGRMCEPEKK